MATPETPVVYQPPIKRRRRALTLATRLEIIEKAKTGLSHRAIAELVNVNKSSVNFTLQRRKFFVEAAANGAAEDSLRLRPPRNPDLDHDVETFFHWMRLAGWGCTGAMLRDRALRAADRLGVLGFKASNGWLHNFQRKKGICMKGVVLKGSSGDVDGEGDGDGNNNDPGENFVGGSGVMEPAVVTGGRPIIVNSEVVRRVHKTEGKAMKLLKAELELYSLDNIYTMCETTLFYRSVPDSAAVLCDEKEILVRNGITPIADDRVSVIMCSNASGSHKLPLALVGSEKAPECLRDRECSFPYFVHKNSWMNGIKARQWCKLFVNELRKRTPRPALLLMELFMDDTELVGKKVKAVTIPHREDDAQLPLKAGLTKHLKRRYKEQLAIRFVQGLENYNELRRDAINIAVGRRGLQYAYPAHLVDTAEILGNIWSRVTPAMIAECWHKSKCMRESRLQELASIMGASTGENVTLNLGVTTEKDQAYIEKLAERITLLNASFAAVSHRNGEHQGAGHFSVDANKIRQEIILYLEEDDQIGEHLGPKPNQLMLFRAFEGFAHRDKGYPRRPIETSDHGMGAFGHFTGAAVDQSLPYSQLEAGNILKSMMATTRNMQSCVVRFDNPLLNGALRDLLTILSKEREKYRRLPHESEASPAPTLL